MIFVTLFASKTKLGLCDLTQVDGAQQTVSSSVTLSQNGFL